MHAILLKAMIRPCLVSGLFFNFHVMPASAEIFSLTVDSVHQRGTTQLLSCPVTLSFERNPPEITRRTIPMRIDSTHYEVQLSVRHIEVPKSLEASYRQLNFAGLVGVRLSSGKEILGEKEFTFFDQKGAFIRFDIPLPDSSDHMVLNLTRASD